MLHRLCKIFRVLPVQKFPVPCDLQLSFLKKPILPWLYLPDSLKHTASRQPSGPQQDQLCNPFPVQPCLYCRILQNGFHLRGKEQPVPVLHIEQGLHANPVTGEKQASAFLLPDGEGKNSVQLIEACRAVFRVCVQDDLCIRIAEKGVPAVRQHASQRFCVVKLSVVNKCIALPCPVQ